MAKHSLVIIVLLSLFNGHIVVGQNADSNAKSSNLLTLRLPKAEIQLFWLDTVLLLATPIRAALVVRNYGDVNLTIADSATNFAPFELVNKEKHVIETHSCRTDSAVYWLQTLSIDSLQRFRLVAKSIINNGLRFDTLHAPLLKFHSRLTPEMTEPFLIHTIPEEKPRETNEENDYTGFVIITLSYGILLIAYLSIKPIKRYWKKHQLKKEWQKLVVLCNTLQSNPNDATHLRSFNQSWKEYLDSSGLYNACTAYELKSILPKRFPYFNTVDPLVRLCEIEEAIFYALTPINQALEDEITQLCKTTIPLLQEEYKKRHDAVG